MPLVLRSVKGSQLTFNEMDGNFTYLEGLDQDKLTTSSFNTFTSSYTTGSFTGSFRGDGSGLTGIPGVTPIATGSFATTGSNIFVGNQTITGSLILSSSAAVELTVIGNQTLTSGSLIVTGSSLFISPSYGNGIGNEKSGSRFTQNTTTLSMIVKPSGSSNSGVISVYDNEDGSSTVNLYGSSLLIGNTSANFILFGNASTNSNFFGTYNFRTGINVTGSFLVTGSANINGPISQTGLGTRSTIIGSGSGLLLSGQRLDNSFFGAFAGQKNTTGTNNSFFGSLSGRENSVGVSNSYFGNGAGQNNTSGSYNSSFGYWAGYNLISGSFNTLVGPLAGVNLYEAANNIALGSNAGIYEANGSTALEYATSSIFIGNDTRANSNNQTNQIVIGNNAIGNGSNTTTIGNTSTTATHLRGTLNVTRQILSEVSSSLNFANDTLAAAGGVPLGGLYRNGNAIQIRLV